MSVVRDFCGHGLGRLFHDEPNIVHVGRPGEGIVLKPGMFFTVEPMINLGRPHVKVLSDGWTAVTRDRSLSAQFEHTVGVTADGVEIFTLSPKGLDKPPYRGLSRAASVANDCNSRHPVDLQRGVLRASVRRSASASAKSWRKKRKRAAKPRPRRGRAALSRPSRAAARRASARPAPTPSPTTSCSSWCCSAPSRGATSSRSPRR